MLTKSYISIKCVCQDTVGLIVQIYVHILHMGTDVKDIVTVAIPRVMYPQAVKPLQQVFLYFKENAAAYILF